MDEKEVPDQIDVLGLSPQNNVQSVQSWMAHGPLIPFWRSPKLLLGFGSINISVAALKLAAGSEGSSSQSVSEEGPPKGP